MKKLTLALVAALAFAGCNSDKNVAVQSAHASLPTPTQCVTMNCVLAQQPQLHALAVPRAVAPAADTGVLLHGIDFAWTKFGPSFAGDFGAGYISHDPTKDLTRSLVAQYHAAHRGTVAVFETTQGRATAGCAAGAFDARFSEARLNGWGYRQAHFDMAVDFDANINQVADYFRCANGAEPGLVGAYGSAYVVNGLSRLGYVHKSWPTYAWLYRTGGVWPSVKDGPLRQVLNGNDFDRDIALAKDYGQFPTPIVGEDPAVTKVRKQREAFFRSYHILKCKYPQQTGECRWFGNAIVKDQAILWKTYPRWALFGPRVTKKGLASEIAFVVRPEVAYWSHARDASRRAFDDHVCGGATGTQGLTPDCKVWKQRWNWFGAHAAAEVKANS